MQKSEYQLKNDLIEIGRRMWQRSFVASNDGNLSIRLDNGFILTTPTGISKGFMQPSDILTVDISGKVINGESKPSSELKMHLEAYRKRPDIKAIVHAHPPYSTAYACCEVALDQCLLPEIVVMIGSVPVARYATPIP